MRHDTFAVRQFYMHGMSSIAPRLGFGGLRDNQHRRLWGSSLIFSPPSTTLLQLTLQSCYSYIASSARRRGGPGDISGWLLTVSLLLPPSYSTLSYQLSIEPTINVPTLLVVHIWHLGCWYIMYYFHLIMTLYRVYVRPRPPSHAMTQQTALPLLPLVALFIGYLHRKVVPPLKTDSFPTKTCSRFPPENENNNVKRAHHNSKLIADAISVSDIVVEKQGRFPSQKRRAHWQYIYETSGLVDPFNHTLCWQSTSSAKTRSYQYSFSTLVKALWASASTAGYRCSRWR